MIGRRHSQRHRSPLISGTDEWDTSTTKVWRSCSTPETTTSTTVIACHHAMCVFGKSRQQSHSKRTAAETTGDISVINNEDIARLLKKLLDLNSRGTETTTPPGQAEPAAEVTVATPPLECNGCEKNRTNTRHEPDRSIAHISRAWRHTTYEHTRKGCRHAPAPRTTLPPLARTR